MAQDSDVARVAAALKAPGIRYKSFGNDPVRAPAQPVQNVANSFPLLGAAMESAAAAPMPQPMPHPMPLGEPAPEPAATETAPPTYARYAAPSIPEAPAPLHAEPAPASFTPPPASFGMGSAAGQFPFGAPPAYPEPAAPQEPAGAFPGFDATPSGFGPASLPQQGFPHQQGFGGAADAAQNNYRLLESIGRPAELPAPAGIAHAPMPHATGPGGTFGALMSGAQPGSTLQSFGPPGFGPVGLGQAGLSQAGFSQGGFGPPAAPAGNWPGQMPSSALLPAAMVTLPLAEVMRLVAVGAPVVSSPFAAFRVSGGAPNSR